MPKMERMAGATWDVNNRQFLVVIGSDEWPFMVHKI
jgi:hypothetical protein